MNSNNFKGCIEPYDIQEISQVMPYMQYTSLIYMTV